MTYTLWDTETSNQFGQFEDEREVLALVRTLIDRFGPGYAEDLGLGRTTGEGSILEPLSGAALIARVDDVLSELGAADETAVAPIGARRENRGVA